MKEVAIIIINYNTASYTLDCIASIEEHTDTALSYEIIVIDNASAPDDFELLEKNFPKNENYKLHRSPINTGFGGGNMLGVQFANANYLVFFNNDALLLNDTFSILKKYMDAHLTVGLTSAQNYDQDEQFVASFDHFKDFWRVFLGRKYLHRKNPERYPLRKKQYEHPLTVNWVNGCLLFFRSTDFAEIGGFDTNIFLYFEEMDICKRLENSGKTTVLIPEARIQHFMSKSTGISERINKEAFLSHLYVVQKHYSKFHYKSLQWYYAATLIFKRKKWHLAPIAWRGTNLSYSLKHQQKIQF